MDFSFCTQKKKNEILAFLKVLTMDFCSLLLLWPSHIFIYYESYACLFLFFLLDKKKIFFSFFIIYFCTMVTYTDIIKNNDKQTNKENQRRSLVYSCGHEYMKKTNKRVRIYIMPMIPISIFNFIFLFSHFFLSFDFLISNNFSHWLTMISNFFRSGYLLVWRQNFFFFFANTMKML